jgi:hypothetical protein
MEVTMNIDNVSTSMLRPYAGNARTHSKRQIRKIAKSIERFGFCNPVLADDSLQIIAGHGRVEAAKLLGMSFVPTVRLSHLSDAVSGLMSSPTTSSPKTPAGIVRSWPLSCRAIDLGVPVGITGFEIAERTPTSSPSPLKTIRLKATSSRSSVASLHVS